MVTAARNHNDVKFIGWDLEQGTHGGSINSRQKLVKNLNLINFKTEDCHHGEEKKFLINKK